MKFGMSVLREGFPRERTCRAEVESSSRRLGQHRETLPGHFLPGIARSGSREPVLLARVPRFVGEFRRAMGVSGNPWPICPAVRVDLYRGSLSQGEDGSRVAVYQRDHLGSACYIGYRVIGHERKENPEGNLRANCAASCGDFAHDVGKPWCVLPSSGRPFLASLRRS